MKLTRTAAVIGFLALSSTAAHASTFGFGFSWNAYSSLNSIQQVSEEPRASVASLLFRQYNHSSEVRAVIRNRIESALPRIRAALRERERPTRPTETSDVPLPASGLLLVGALGALALRQRKKS